jgi:hypothetical protein
MAASLEGRGTPEPILVAQDNLTQSGGAIALPSKSPCAKLAHEPYMPANTSLVVPICHPAF